MNRHDNAAAWAAITIAGIFHILVAAATLHALATSHASAATAIIIGAPSIIALTAAALCKAAARPMPAPRN